MRLRMPEGLEDVSKVPNVVAELLRRGWTDSDVKAALGNNLLRVMREAEKVSGDAHRHTRFQQKEKVLYICTKALTHRHPSHSNLELRPTLTLQTITDDSLLTAFTPQCIFQKAPNCIHPH